MKRRFLVGVIFVCALGAAPPAAARFDPIHSWRTLETAHFTVHFHEGGAELAGRAALIAESVHARLAPRVGWAPQARTRLIIADDADAAGGWASPYPFNQILITPTPPLGEPGLGTTRHDGWLRLVITHEYTHILQLDMASRFPLALRALFGRLYFPNTLQPEWLIEGLATFEETELTTGGRGRSPGAEMILRMAVLEKRFPTLDLMAVLPDPWPAGQTPYLFGEAFLRYLDARFGREKIAGISRAYGGRPLPFLVGSTGRSVLGASYRELGRDWIAGLEARFLEQQRVVVADGLTAATALTDDGCFNGAPAWSPDGRRIAWLRADRHGYPGIWVMNADGSGRRRLVKNSFSTASSGASLAWSPDGTRLYYTKRGVVRGAALLNDIWAYDFLRQREIRVTRGLRARDPDLSLDGRTLALVTSSGGRTRLAFLDVDGSLPARETARLRFSGEPSAEQYAGPRWSPDGQRLVLSVRTPDGAKEIRVLDRDGRLLKRAVHAGALVGAPTWSPDGRRIYCSSDATGIFNIFSWDPSADEFAQLTNVLGGAFSPAPSPDGRRLAFVDYTARGYDIRVLELDSVTPRPFPPGNAVAALVPNLLEPAGGASAVVAQAAGGPASTPYSPLDTVLPRLWFPWAAASTESGTLFGFVTGGQDVLQRHSYTLTALYGPESGRLMHAADYRYEGLRPTLRLLSSDIDRSYSHLLHEGPDNGDYTERERTVGLEATLAFPGLVSSQAISLGYRYRELSALAPTAAAVDSPEEGPAVGSLGSTRLAWSFTNASRQPFSISLEDGGSTTLGLERFQDGLGSDRSFTRATVDCALYLPLPGPHHVLATRLFLGGADGDTPPQGAFRLGGNQPGDVAYSLDDRALSLRGYRPGAFRGSRAFLASIEYRFPLAEVDRGANLAPFFLRRVHGAVFVDAGEAWEADRFRAAAIRTGLGAEVRFDLFFSYYLPLTVHLGLAAGLGEEGGIYPTLGISLPHGPQETLTSTRHLR